MRNTCVPQDDLLFFIEEELPASRKEEIHTHLVTCGACSSRLDWLRRTRQSLVELDDGVLNEHLLPAVRAAIANLPQSYEQRVPRWRYTWWGLGALAASLIAFVALTNTTHDEFRRKSDRAGSNIDTWVGVTTYRVQDSDAVLLGSTMTPTDGLAFSYRNSGERPKRFLAVFAVDSRDNIHWYYPAYTNSDDDPESLAIDPAPVPRLLPDKIQHDLPRGTLTITALFTDTPLRVSEIEQTILRHRLSAEKGYSFAHAIEQNLVVQVEP